MSKERLEGIKRNTRQLGKMSDPPIFYRELDESDYQFLIEQAERYDECRLNAMELYKQNQRYREALEFYADKATYEVVETLPPTDEYQQPIEPVYKTVPIIYYDNGKEARKALEGERDER